MYKAEIWRHLGMAAKTRELVWGNQCKVQLVVYGLGFKLTSKNDELIVPRCTAG